MLNRLINYRLTAALLLIAGLAEFPGCHGRASSQHPTKDRSSVVPPAKPAGVQDPPAPLVHTDFMAEAFRTGKLPAPLPAPGGDPDAAAAELASKIAAADAQSTPALIAALQMSGFSIRSEDAATLVKPTGPPQGLAFHASSVAAMAKLSGEGWSLSLSEFSVILGKALPALQKAPVGAILIDGISKAAQGEQPLRFWSRLIVELGRQSTPSYDVLDSTVDPADIQLNAIQISLILQRLMGDFLASDQREAPALHAFNNGRAQRPKFVLAAFHPADRFRVLPIADSESSSSPPCDLGEDYKTLLDGFAILKTTEWEKLIELEKQAEKSDWKSRVNTVSTLLKFIWTYAAMNIEITMDNPPLIRTPGLEKGETRLLTAHVWFEIQNWQLLNCLRPLLNAQGLDFGNLPNHGAAQGVGIEWALLGGGVPKSVTTRNIPAFLEAQRSALVMFDNGPGSDGATWNKETDEQGKSSIQISGRPQGWDMTNFKRFPVMKKIAVAVNIAYKHNGTADKMLGELLDVIGPAAGVSSGDILGGLTGAISEMMFRMHWFSSRVFEFPVRDWITCRKGWGGTITYTRTLHSVQPVVPPKVPGLIEIGSHSHDLAEHGEFVLAGGEAHANWGDSTGKWSVTINKKDLFVEHTSARNSCGPIIRDYRTESSTTGSDSGDGTARIYAGPGDLLGKPGWVYSMALEIPVLHASFSSVDRSVQNAQQAAFRGCVPDNGDRTYSGGDTVVINPPFHSLQGPVDPKHPDEIHDTQTITDAATGIKTQINVDLVRCEDK